MGSRQEPKLTWSEQLPGPHMYWHFHGPIYQCDLFLDQFPANLAKIRDKKIVSVMFVGIILLSFCDYYMDAHTYIVLLFSRKQFFKFDAKFKLICDNTNCTIL